MIKIIKEKYRAAVIGVGRIGMKLELDKKRIKPATHFGMWNNQENVDLIAVCDTSDDNLKIAKKLNPDIKLYNNAEELLKKEKPDIVSIATWKDTHYDIMKLCIKYNIPAIVCEKPIAEKIEHAREIVNETKDNGIHLFINHRRRFDPLLYPFKNDLLKGKLGEIVQVNAHYVYGLVTTGTHLVDALRFFLCDLAGEVEWVIGIKHNFENFSPPDDPGINFILGFNNGLNVAIQTLDIKKYDIFDFYFYGTKGLAVFKNIGRDIEIYDIVDSSEHDGFTELNDQYKEKHGGNPRDQFGYLAKNVIESLQGESASLSTGADSLIALEILLAIQESAKNNSKKVYLK